MPETTLVREPAGEITVVLPDDAPGRDAEAGLAAQLHEALERFSPGTAS